MKDVRFTEDGVPRCWKCGSISFEVKRTFRSKLFLGVGSLATKKKLKCLRCGKYNQRA